MVDTAKNLTCPACGKTMKKVLFMAVAACLIFAACGNNGGNTKGDKESNEPKVEVVIPDNFTEYDCSGFTISYPNELYTSWDGDEMVNLTNNDGSVFIDATFSSFVFFLTSSSTLFVSGSVSTMCLSASPV